MDERAPAPMNARDAAPINVARRAVLGLATGALVTFLGGVPDRLSERRRTTPLAVLADHDDA